MKMKENRNLSAILNDRTDADFRKLESEYKKGINDTSSVVRFSSLINLGSLYLESKMYQESEAYLLKALEVKAGKAVKSKLSVAYKNLGTANLKLFKLPESEKYYIEALKITPKNNKRIVSFIYSGLGDVYTKMTRMNEGLEYYFKSLELREKLKIWKGISQILNKIGVNYFYQSNYDKALEFISRSLKIREERHENAELIADCLNNISLTYFHKGDYPKALDYGTRALSIYERSGSSENQGMSYNNLGLIYFEMSLFSQALECQFKALKLKEHSDNKPLIANSLSNLGMIFSRIYNLEKALEYSMKALELRKSVDDKRGIASSYNEIGRIYDKMNQFDKAISYFEDSINMRREMNFLSGLALSLENLGMVYFKLEKFQESKSILFEAKNIAEELKENKTVSGIYRNIANLYLNQNKYDEALFYIKRSYEIAKSHDLKDKLRDANKMFSEIYGRKNNFKKALGYYVLYSKLNEEILNITKQHEINNISQKYENFRKERESEFNRLKNIELVRVNKELRRSKTELLKSNSAKDKFFNIIAHDLKNPFSILYTTSELLITYFDELTVIKQKEYVKTINTSTLHLLKLIENLLEWSRTQSGLKQFNPENFNLSNSLGSCIELIRPSAEVKKISVKAEIPDDLMIYADKNMLKTVIRNLLTNAVKFTRQNGTVSVMCEVSEGKFTLKVADTGVGIKKKDISKIFAIDKHFVTNGTANEKGTGIGLILCREFIEKHKGKMIIESKFRKGSTFGFEIPVK